jgi:hypothetical protein
MIKRLYEKLRMTGLEDALSLQLGIEQNTANWLARMGADVARRESFDLLALERGEQLAQMFTRLQQAGYGELLDRVAGDAPALAARMKGQRTSAGQALQPAA